jgi:ABC-type nitrate/sulfonate/bicarbonate transport system substrate-binding protein
MRSHTHRTQHLRLLAIVTALIGLASLSACASQPEQPDEHLVFMAGYKPQANLPFVGVYVAQEKGFFAEERLTVEIRHSAGGGEHLQLLVAGKVDITTQDAAVLLKRRIDPGLPLVSIALIGQQGQQAFVALADAGIRTLEDWRGKQIGFKGTPPPELLALLDAAGLEENEVALINVGFDPRVLTEGLIDIYPVFNSNEPYLLQSWGYSLTLWEPADFDIPTLGLTYVTTDATMEAAPEKLERFLRAALRGIDYAAEHPDEAVEIVLRFTGPDTDPDHMRYMLETELRGAYGPATLSHGVGWQTAEQWDALLNTLLRYGAVTQRTDTAQLFTTRFMPGGAD